MIKLEIFEKPPENEIKLFIQSQPVFSSTPPITDEGAILVPPESIASRIGALVYATNMEKEYLNSKQNISIYIHSKQIDGRVHTVPSGHSGEDNKFYRCQDFQMMMIRFLCPT
ncbi:MAG: hypothetical protein R2883_04790 [Caldisericia bacterium]